jgi:hypothetical protein
MIAALIVLLVVAVLLAAIAWRRVTRPRAVAGSG